MNTLLKLALPLAAGLLVASCDKGSDVELPVTPLQLSESCDVKAGCVAVADDVSLHLSIGPDMRALVPFPVTVVVQGEQRADSVTASFAMRDMDMGLNRYQLINDGAQRWFANVTLPVCSSGRSDWIAVVEVLSKGRRFAVEVPFVMDK